MIQQTPPFAKGVLDYAKILGVVMAGGKSSRMGTDKALLTINRKSFLDTAKSRLLEVGIKKVLISANNIDGALQDRIKHCGPLSALHSLAHYADLNQYNMAMICPVDMPLVDVGMFKQLAAFSHETHNTSYFENTPLPFCLWLDKTFIEVVENQMANKRYALRDLLSRLNANVYSLPKDKEHLVRNINTPEEFEGLKKIASHNK